MRAALALVAVLVGAARALAFVTAVDSVGLTVADMERSLAFYTTVLPFQKVSDVEAAGPEYEKLTGVFGCRLRIVRLRLGDEFLHARLLSKGIADVPQETAGFEVGLTARDPDGHAVQVVQP